MPFDITPALCGIHGDASQPNPPGVLSVPQEFRVPFIWWSEYSPQLLGGQEPTWTGSGQQAPLPRSWGRDSGAEYSWACPPLWFLTLLSGIQEAALRGDGEAVGRRLAQPPFKPEQFHSSLLSGSFHIRCHWKKRALTA